MPVCFREHARRPLAQNPDDFFIMVMCRKGLSGDLGAFVVVRGEAIRCRLKRYLTQPRKTLR